MKPNKRPLIWQRAPTLTIVVIGENVKEVGEGKTGRTLI